MSKVGSPVAVATSDSAPDHLPQVLRQSALCSVVRGGPAVRRSHPGRRDILRLDIEIYFHSKNTFYSRIFLP